MQPINYSIGQAPNPQDSFLSGIQQGTALNAMQMQREQQAAQQQAAMAAQRRIQSVLGNPNASHDDLVSIIPLMDPKMSAEVLKAREAADKGKAQAAVSHGMQVVAALRSPSPEVGVQMLEDRATALENSGRPQDAARFRGIAAQAKANPSAAANMVGIGLAGLPGAKDAFESLGKLGEATRAEEQAPGALRKVNADAAAAEADAQTKAITAKYGEQSALLDLQKKGWDIKALQADMAFKREANRIAAMNAAAAQAGNGLKQQELQLKVDAARQALDEKVRTHVADGESAVTGVRETIALIDDIRTTNPDALKGAIGASAWLGLAPGSPERTVAGKIERLQSTLAAVNLDKLKGAMSDKDILFLKSIASNLDRWQNQDGFMSELGRIERVMQEAEPKVRAKYGMPKASAGPTPAPGQPKPIVVDW